MAVARGVPSARSGADHHAPFLESRGAEMALCDGPQEVSPNPKQVQDGRVDGEEALGAPGRFEAAHESFPDSRRLVGGLGAIVEAGGAGSRLLYVGQPRIQRSRCPSSCFTAFGMRMSWRRSMRGPVPLGGDTPTLPPIGTISASTRVRARFPWLPTASSTRSVHRDSFTRLTWRRVRASAAWTPCSVSASPRGSSEPRDRR